MRFPRLAHRSAAAHKLHSTPQQHRMNLNFGERVQPAADYRPLAYSSPEAVQTTGTVVRMSGPFVPPNAKVTPARISPAVRSLMRAPRSPKSTAVLSLTCQIAPM